MIRFKFDRAEVIDRNPPPPDAVMNPRYAGIRQDLLSTDEAAYCINYSSWPNP
jgi:hypothetical protein